MSDPLDPPVCAQMLAALAAPERLRIVRYLRNQPRNVSEIADMLRTAAVNVAHHMGILRGARIVDRRKQGRFVYYSLAANFLQMTEDGGGHEYFNLGCCRLEVPKAAQPPPAGAQDSPGPAEG